jgi:periplasmic copper chaperone A
MIDLKRMKLALPLIALAFAACGHPPELRVDGVKLVLSPVDSNPSALYFTIHGGVSDNKLLAVNSPSVIRMEMHESAMDASTGMMTMTPLKDVPVPARSKVQFKQGGKHVMVWGANLKARKLGEMETEFLFGNGDRIVVDAVVEEMDGTIPDERKALGY